MRVMVVGGGITGLAAAYFLQERARAAGLPISLSLLEASPRLGGKVGTDLRQGFVLETGPESFLAAKPWALDLCRRIGIDGLHTEPVPGKRTFVLWKGRLHTIPEGLATLAPTRPVALLKSDLFSLGGKLRMAIEPLIPPRRDSADETLGAFVRRRVGREMLERVAGPLLGGAYAGDPETLSLLATFPRLRESELRHRSLTVSGLKARRQSAGPPKPPFITLRPGLGRLPETLVQCLQDARIHTGSPVKAIERGKDGYRLLLAEGTGLEADAIVLATPAYVAADLLKRLLPEASDLLAGIPYVSSAVVSLAYRRDAVAHPLDGTGFVVPHPEGRALTACTWTSSKWPERAPEGFVLLRAFFGRRGREEVASLPEEDLGRLAVAELRDLLGLRGEPVFAAVHRWEKGLPHYPVGHLERMARLSESLKATPGLVLAGAGYRGLGVPDCVRQAEEAAASIIPGIPAAKRA